MTYPVKIKLTRFESQYINHRAACPDALADALGETYEDGVGQAADEIWRQTGGNDANACEITISSQVEADTLIDCIEGSTWVGTMGDDYSEQIIGQTIARAEKLAAKVCAALGRERIRVPIH